MSVEYAGVDWLTMTSQDETVGQNWWAMYVQYRKVRRGEANEETPFSNGFYSGLKIASMRWGYSDTIGYIVIISGGDAEKMYQRLQPAKHKVTRLDICIDFSFADPIALANIIYHTLEEEDENKQRKYKLWISSDGGATAYIGSRQSHQFGRIYDKGIQSGRAEQGQLWRAEVEYKKPIAGQIARGLSEVKPEERGGLIRNQVRSWFDERGADLEVGGDIGELIEVTVEQRTTTANKKLAWLRQQVAPTIGQLIEAGYGKEVLFSLMLDEKALTSMMLSEN